MGRDQRDYELFISYARLDNKPAEGSDSRGWVSALRDEIAAEYRRHEPSDLRIFFDIHEIRDMDQWRHRILGGLRRSKVLLICLSPNYFKSQACRWEWEEYLARQHQTLAGSEPHATIYFVEVPGTDNAEHAAWLKAILGAHHTDLRHWFPLGPVALREAAVQQKIAVLGQSLWERLRRVRLALSVPGNLRELTNTFVGRNHEIEEIHRLVGVGKIGVVTAVHGLGGQGKTELAVAYAHRYADDYPLGLWSLEAEFAETLLPLIGRLAFDTRFGYTVSEAERADANALGLGVLGELKKRADEARVNDPNHAPAALLILDNVSKSSLLGETQLSTLPSADWLRIIATTRLDPATLGPAQKRLGAVEVDSLDPENALRLIRDHLPGERFASPQDEADAREIVRELGGFTLAVEQVAVFLGLYHAAVSPGEYLAELRSKGLPSTDELVNTDTKESIHHPTKLLRPILESMLGSLDEPGRTLLSFASLLPPDRIPWPWLKELTIERHPELAETTLPNPWKMLQRQVLGLRLLSGSTEPESARMHRLIASHLEARASQELITRMGSYLDDRADAVYRQPSKPADWELNGLLEAIPHWLKTRSDPRLAVSGVFLVEKTTAYRTLVSARSLLQTTHRVLRSSAESDPGNAESQRDLSISLNKLGDVSVSSGDLSSARGYFAEGLQISRRLSESDPGNAQMQRDLSISLDRLGDVSVSSGDLSSARGYFAEGLQIRRRLSESDPGNAQMQRGLSISLNKLGEVSVSSGDLSSARGYFAEGLQIRRRLSESDPGNAESQRDLSVSLNKLGDVSVSSGDLSSARGYFAEGLQISRRLSESDPGNAQMQRDLVVSYWKIGNLLERSGREAEALSHFHQAYEILSGMVNRGLHVSPSDRAFLAFLGEKLGRSDRE